MLENGNIKKASELLGNEYTIEAKVVEGRKLGKELGYPTANLELLNEYKLLPKPGIYAVKVRLFGEDHGGMMSIGTNPTVTDEMSLKCEVHIFDFNKNIYGKNVKVSFVEYLREERKFDSLEELRIEMRKDEDTSREILTKELKEK